MERKAVAYHQRVRAGYLAMAAADPERWLIVDALLPVEAVQQTVQQATAQRCAVNRGGD
jgi:dTMP kinase